MLETKRFKTIWPIHNSVPNGHLFSYRTRALLKIVPNTIEIFIKIAPKIMMP